MAEGNPHRDDYVQITTKTFREVLTSEEDVSHLKSCEVQLECRVGAFGKDGKATQWQKEILTATITFK